MDVISMGFAQSSLQNFFLKISPCWNIVRLPFEHKYFNTLIKSETLQLHWFVAPIWTIVLFVGFEFGFCGFYMFSFCVSLFNICGFFNLCISLLSFCVLLVLNFCGFVCLVLCVCGSKARREDERNPTHTATISYSYPKTYLLSFSYIFLIHSDVFVYFKIIPTAPQLLIVIVTQRHICWVFLTYDKVSYESK